MVSENVNATSASMMTHVSEKDHVESDKSHGMRTYTMDDIKKAFAEDFCDEVEDSNRYCDMAHAAETAGHKELAHGLYEMSHDEFTHAKFIHDNLVDWGYEFSEKESMKWHELKERIQRKFR